MSESAVKFPVRHSLPLRAMLRGHIWVLAGLVPLVVKFVSIKALLSLFTPPPGLRPYRGIDSAEISRLVSWRLRNPRNMRRRACLRHGLTLFHFLRLAGYRPVLRIGVYPASVDPNRTHAHCWVCLDDVCLSTPPDGVIAVVVTHGP